MRTPRSASSSRPIFPRTAEAEAARRDRTTRRILAGRGGSASIAIVRRHAMGHQNRFWTRRASSVLAPTPTASRRAVRRHRLFPAIAPLVRGKLRGPHPGVPRENRSGPWVREASARVSRVTRRALRRRGERAVACTPNTGCHRRRAPWTRHAPGSATKGRRNHPERVAEPKEGLFSAPSPFGLASALRHIHFILLGSTDEESQRLVRGDRSS
jgi:hypothetical protein